MHDELERSRDRMQLPNVDKPYFIQYRLVVDVRTITGHSRRSCSTSTSHNRLHGCERPHR